MENLKIENKDFGQFSFINGLRSNPAKTKAFFIVAKADFEDNEYKRNLWLLDLKTKKSRQLTFDGKVASAFWFDDETLVFQASRTEKEKKYAEENKDLTPYYQLSLQGGEASLFFTAEGLIEKIEKLDEKTFVVITAKKPALLPDEKTAKDYKHLTQVPYYFNGRGFISGKTSSLGLLSRETGKIDLITTNEDEHVDNFVVKNNKILFVSSTYTALAPDWNQIKEYDLLTKQTTTLLEKNLFSVYRADYFLDNPTFMGVPVDSYYGINSNPGFYQFKDGKPTLVYYPDYTPGSSTIGDCYLSFGPNFIIDNDKIYYTRLDKSETTICTLSPSFKSKRLFTPKGSIECFDLTKDSIIFCGLRDMHLQELYELKGSTVTTLTSFNSAFTDTHYVAQPEKIEFKSGPYFIEGWVLKPINYDPAKSYPAILDIHGGPKAAYGPIFFHEMQVWASAGYFVFFCNPRGGDGRGNKFADIRGKYGTIDYTDLMTFTNTVLASYPQIDATRLGVTGGSYGGFMTNWIIGHTSRFKAAASQRSISNWLSFWGTSDIGPLFTKDQNDADLWDNPQKLWFHSPLKYANNCTTPTLFIHSDEDYRCPLEQGLQMYSALVSNNIEAKLTLFHHENHELSRSGKPLHRLHRLDEILTWMNSHLSN